eukprot:GSMAST32.ASY1.ANO1.2649.1 assembled CDS
MAAVAKIAEIELEISRTQKNKATAKHLGSLKAKLAKLRRFEVQKSGDTRVGLIGFPSVGKSTLLSVIYYKGAKIQLLDLPGIIEGAKDGKGRGKQIIATARTCNVLLKELAGFSIRLNQQPPNIKFKKKEKGGISFTCKDKSLDIDTVKSVLSEYRIHNADVNIREPILEQLIDVIEGNRIYMPCLYVLNKIDSISIEELDLLSTVPHYVC